MKKLLLLVSCLLCLASFAQEDTIQWRVVPSLTDWIQEINNSKDSVYVANDIKILIDMKKDSLLAHYGRDWLKYRDKNEPIQAIVNKPIQLRRWYLDTGYGTNNSMVVKNIRFEKSVRLSDMKSYGIGLRNVQFEDEFRINGHTRDSWFRFRRCTFDKDVSFSNINGFARITFDQSELNKSLYTFQTPGAPLLRVVKSTIKEQMFLRFIQMKQLYVVDSEIGVVVLENARVATAVYLTNTKIKYIDIEGAAIPENNTYIPFDQVTNKLCVYRQTRQNGVLVPNPYLARERITLLKMNLK